MFEFRNAGVLNGAVREGYLSHDIHRPLGLLSNPTNHRSLFMNYSLRWEWPYLPYLVPRLLRFHALGHEFQERLVL